MADENTTSAQEGTAQSQPAGGSATAGARTFTEDKVNEIVRDRLAREREKYADYEDAKAKAKQTDELKAALEMLTQERDAANVELEGPGEPEVRPEKVVLRLMREMGLLAAPPRAAGYCPTRRPQTTPTCRTPR